MSIHPGPYFRALPCINIYSQDLFAILTLILTLDSIVFLIFLILDFNIHLLYDTASLFLVILFLEGCLVVKSTAWVVTRLTPKTLIGCLFFVLKHFLICCFFVLNPLIRCLFVTLYNLTYLYYFPSIWLWKNCLYWGYQHIPTISLEYPHIGQPSEHLPRVS